MGQQSNPDEPRELSPVQKFWGPDGVKDFGPHPVPADSVEDTEEEVEEVLTPVPKDSSALEFASYTDSTLSSAPLVPDFRVLPVTVTPTVSPEDADKESGKDSESSEGEPPLVPDATPSRENSSQSSSSGTSPGSSEPPASVPPPPVASPPVVPTTPPS